MPEVKKQKVHFLRTTTRGMCGVATKRMSRDPAAVTCLKCKHALRLEEEARAERDERNE